MFPRRSTHPRGPGILLSRPCRRPGTRFDTGASKRVPGRIWRRGWDSNPWPVAGSPVFKTGSLNHSDTSPKQLSDSFIITHRLAFVKHFFNFFQIFFKDLRFVKAVTWKFLSFQATSIYYHGFSKMSTPFFDFFQVFLLLLFFHLLILFQFTRPGR